MSVRGIVAKRLIVNIPPATIRQRPAPAKYKSVEGTCFSVHEKYQVYPETASYAGVVA
jgi:hypothetical protein